MRETSLPARWTHIPELPEPFVGRTEELRFLVSSIERRAGKADSSSLTIVELTGRGGIGKTTLGLAVAHSLRDAFPDYILTLNSHSRGSSTDTEDEWLDRLAYDLLFEGVHSRDESKSRLAGVREALRDKRGIVVLDLEESRLEDSLDSIKAARRVFSGLLILTSRFRIGLRGAIRLQLSELSQAASIDMLRQYISVSDSESDLAQLVEISGRLPLTLAMLRTSLERGSTARELVELLRRDVSLPQASFEQLYAEIYTRRLSPQTRRVLDIAIALPVESISMECMAAAVRSTITAEVELSNLVGMHILSRDLDSGFFRVHDLVRAAAHQLGSRTKESFVQTAVLRACEWYTEKSNDELEGIIEGAQKSSQPANSWFQQEFDNAIQILSACARGEVDFVPYNLASALAVYAQLSGQNDRWLTIAELEVSFANRVNDSRHALERMQEIAISFTEWGRIEEARGYIAAALRLSETLGEWTINVQLLRTASELEDRDNRYDMAVGYLESSISLGLAKNVGDAEVGRSLERLGRLHYEHGDMRDAVDVLESAVAYSSDSRYQVLALLGLASSYEALGRTEEKLRVLNDAKRISGGLMDFDLKVLVLVQRGSSLIAVNLLEEAEADLLEAAKLARDAEETSVGVGVVLLADLADALSRVGRTDEAYPLLFRSIARARSSNDDNQILATLLRGVSVHNRQGETAEAEKLLRDALVIARGLGASGLLVELLVHLADHKRADGDTEEAVSRLREARTLAEELNDRALIGVVLSRLANIALQERSFREAIELAEEGASIGRELKDSRLEYYAVDVLRAAYESVGLLEDAQAAAKRADSIARSLTNLG